ncbi:hypothetical protein [Pelagibius sp. Alg239-R121]|uniref:hypothetical protein n=1 Tax=Pelagibius sp. Alg239-R121 TaxID=2993448 RepID=UPI0024A79FE8|nr:hypothetical protein [Pelagibius sp. Alg239-R121]
MPNKWKTIAALAVVYVAILFELNWVWGLLFIMWLVPAVYSGRTHLVEEVARSENPILFWLILGTWFVLSIYLVLADLLPLFGA